LDDAANNYLNARTYHLANGGLLVAVPEPATALLFLPALIALGARTARHKAR
jgi:hypothetical protein